MVGPVVDWVTVKLTALETWVPTVTVMGKVPAAATSVARTAARPLVALTKTSSGRGRSATTAGGEQFRSWSG